jgi:hypothetical protein
VWNRRKEAERQRKINRRTMQEKKERAGEKGKEEEWRKNQGGREGR